MKLIQTPILSKLLGLVLCSMLVTQSSISYGLGLMERGGNSAINVRANDKNLSSYLKKMYRKDAGRLALRHISDGSDYKNLGTEMPKEVVTELYTSLIAIHEAPYEESKEVTRKHRLHTFPIPAVDMVQIHYKNTSAWAAPLKLGGNETNNEDITTICTKYNLSIESHQIWDEQTNMFIVKAHTPVNLAAIAQLFKNIDGVQKVILPVPDLDGNDIEARRTSKGWQLNYIVKFDSCLTGCKKQRTWSFEVVNINVHSSANVKFIGITGDDLPDWMN